MDLRNDSLQLHEQLKGKVTLSAKCEITNAKELSLLYSPGVAEPCKEISMNKEKTYDYTFKGNMVAIVTNGSAVLGLGNIGPEAALPVMEGKSVLFKNFANIDAFPICLDSEDPDKIIETVKMLSPTFGGINIEDISAPNCFYIEKRLKEELQMPVMHDDQHGTAIVAVAGLLNALKLARKDISKIKVVINGAGAAGTAIGSLLKQFGVQNIIICDRNGAIYEGRTTGMNEAKMAIAKETNHLHEQGTLSEVLIGADVFIGVSVGGVLEKEHVQSMSKDPIIFALANPIPEIMPEDAIAAEAFVICTGRSDYANQVNNVLVFPGVFRGALDARAREINDHMKMAAVHALANMIPENELSTDYVIPSPFNRNVAIEVAVAVAGAAMASGVAIKTLDLVQYKEKLRNM